MHVIEPVLQDYAWGSTTAIQDLIGLGAGRRIAEAWFGAHPLAPSRSVAGESLADYIAADPDDRLGFGATRRFGPRLPYLLKLIAADRPLSLQVHPHIDRAREGFAEEDLAGVPRDAPERNYRDENHKPELVYALTQFEAVCGFRPPRRAAEMFAGLGTPLADGIAAALRAEPSSEGVRRVFTRLVTPGLRPTPEEIGELAAACAARLAAGSPSPRADHTVALLQEAYPGDPGVATSLLLNPVTLQPGEALFVPAGGVHAYLHGLGVEVMASSDNVLRAGLTPKHVDVPEMLRNVDYVAAPPIRIAPEIFQRATKVFFAPVDDFELSVTEVDDDAEHPLPAGGGRVAVALAGRLVLRGSGGELVLDAGQAAFLDARDGAVSVSGRGTLVQASAA